MDNTNYNFLSHSLHFYPDEYPNIGDIVMTNITKIEDEMVYCQLEEYNFQGILSCNEISNKKIRNIKQFLRIGSKECLEVIDIDQDMGYINLSKKDVKKNEIKTCKEKFSSAKKAFNFFHRWSLQTGSDLIKSVLWEYYDSDNSNVYHKLNDTDTWQKELPESIDNDKKNKLLFDFKKSFDSKPQKFSADFEIICFDIDAVQSIKHSINYLLSFSTQDLPLTCSYTGKKGSFGTIYTLSTLTKQKNAQEHIQELTKKIQDIMSQNNSNFRFSIITDK